MYTNQRDAYRKGFIDTWQKHLQQQPLTALEQSIVTVIAAHPEYHAYLTQDSSTQCTDHFELTDNPFFHLSLHLGLRDQIKLDRPQGIQAIFNQQVTRLKNEHLAEHSLMTCLAEALWQSQQTGTPPTDADYLQLLRAL